MIKKQLFFVVAFFALAVLVIGCSVSNDPMRTTIRQLQNGTIKEDTSYVYRLPFVPSSLTLTTTPFRAAKTGVPCRLGPPGGSLQRPQARLRVPLRWPG